MEDQQGFTGRDLIALVVIAVVSVHLWGQNQTLQKENEALRYQVQQSQAEMKGLERGVVISK
jgi:sensor domain CHASE-containing protein